MAKAKAKTATSSGSRMYKNRVALPDAVKAKVVAIMNRKLAASLDMYSQAKFAHWNVKGLNFYQLHLVFDQTANTVFKHIDAIAERITQLGGVANGTVRQSAESSPVPPYNTNAVNGPQHLEALADALGTYCKELRDASSAIDELKDEPSADFFKQLVVESEEELYFLESHLEAGNVQ